VLLVLCANRRRRDSLGGFQATVESFRLGKVKYKYIILLYFSYFYVNKVDINKGTIKKQIIRRFHNSWLDEDIFTGWLF